MYPGTERGVSIRQTRHAVLYVLLVVLVQGGLVAGVAAADWDEDDLFGGSDLISTIDETQFLAAPEDELLTAEGVQLGGRYNFTLGSSWDWDKPERIGKAPAQEQLETNLEATLYLDARPAKDYRVFGKAKVSHPFVEKAPGLTPGEPGRSFHDIVHITELFSDFSHQDRVFFRAGKQTISWGVGYFFSPADIINLTPINPEDPEAEREGPLSLKVNLPMAAHNTYLYVIADQARKVGELAWAPKAEIVLRGAEVGLGSYYRPGRAPMAMATVSSAWGDVAVFGEAVYKHGSDKRYLREVAKTADNPLGWEVYERKGEPFWLGTGGLRYTHTDDEGLYNITLAAQYFANGEGYADPKTVQGIAPLLLAQKKITVTDLLWPGRHYAAASVAWQDLLKTGVSASFLWMGSPSDQSGRATASLSWKPLDRVTTSVGVSYDRRTQNTSLFLRASLGSGQF